MTNKVKIFLISFLALTSILFLIVPVSCKADEEEIPIHLVISKEEIDEGTLRGKIEDLNLTAEEINDKCSGDYSGNIEVAGIAEELELNYEETQILHFINFNRTTREITEGQILDFYKTVSEEKCKSGIYITTSRFSLRAKSSASSKMVDLYDSEYVNRFIEKSHSSKNKQ